MTTDPIRFISIDDNLLDSLAIAACAENYHSLQLLGTFPNAAEGLVAVNALAPDLVFLDIEMPGMNGLELLRGIKARVPMCVFVTSHPEFALEGFELAALDYILKPLTDERFAQTMRRVTDYWDMRKKATAYEVLFEQQMLTIKDGHSQIRLPRQEIIYLEAMQDYTKVVTSKKNYMTNMPLSGFMERLPANDFLRIHRSYAISVAQVKELRQTELLCGHTVLPIGKTYRAGVSQIKW